MKEKICDVAVFLAGAGLIWLIASTMQINLHNLSDHKYSKWNLWRLAFEEEEPEPEEPIKEIRIVGNAPLISGEAHTITNPIESLGEFKITGYCGCAACCGKTDGITATGTHATQGHTIAVDPQQIPYGTEVIIDGQTYIAEDCGGAIKGNRIDLYFDNHSEALAFGVKYKEIFIRR